MNNIDIEQYCQFRTANVWVDKLINCKPLFLMTMYVQAERKGDWHLHMETVKCMVLYFFAADYDLYYLRAMSWNVSWKENLPYII